MLFWRDLGVAHDPTRRRAGPPQQRGPRRRPSTEPKPGQPSCLDSAPRYLLHDRDTAFHAWATTAKGIGI